MKYIILSGALLLGLNALGQGQLPKCEITKTFDEVTRADFNRTQSEVVYSVAGRKWDYYMREEGGRHLLSLKYTQTDMPFSVVKGGKLELTTTDNSVIALTVLQAAEGELRHTKGVKSWSVNLLFPLTTEQMAELQVYGLKEMKLEFAKGQASAKVHQSKSSTIKDLITCITSK